MSRYYDQAGNPIDLETYVAMFKDNRVALDSVGGVEVSTVWLGIDHRFGAGPPLIFETMVFGGEYDEHCWRYSTREQATSGHLTVRDAVAAGRDPEVAMSELDARD